MAFLLDVNVLIALMDGAHVHHEAAHRWFSAKSAQGWMTCPLVENGAVRILSHPSYPNLALPVSDLLERLHEFKSNAPQYRFCPEAVSLTDPALFARAKLFFGNLTDAYLLRVAVQAGAALATLDRRILPAWIGEKNSKILELIPVG